MNGLPVLCLLMLLLVRVDKGDCFLVDCVFLCGLVADQQLDADELSESSCTCAQYFSGTIATFPGNRRS